MMRLGSERGAALLMVVTILGLLALLTAEFQRRSHLEAVLATNNLQSLQAHALARSGYAAAVSMLREDATGSDIDSRTELWYAGDDTSSGHLIPVGDATVSIRIDDLMGRFPLGALIDDNGKPIQPRLDAYERMLLELELEDADVNKMVWALVDWIDDDPTADKYEYNDRFTVPNQRISDITDLLRIEGYNELSPADYQKLLDHVDVRSTPDVNVNTAPPAVLVALHPNLLYGDAEDLYDELSLNPDDATFTATNAFIPPTDRDLTPVTESSRFKMVIKGNINGISKQAECIIERNKADKTIELLQWTQY